MLIIEKNLSKEKNNYKLVTSIRKNKYGKCEVRSGCLVFVSDHNQTVDSEPQCQQQVNK